MEVYCEKFGNVEKGGQSPEHDSHCRIGFRYDGRNKKGAVPVSDCGS